MEVSGFLPDTGANAVREWCTTVYITWPRKRDGFRNVRSCEDQILRIISSHHNKLATEKELQRVLTTQDVRLTGR